jgi:hypothetical protein
MQTHQEIDRRSLAMHCLVAEKIRSDPALLDDVARTLASWRETVCVQSQPYLVEWGALLARGMETFLAAVTEDSEHATALRKSSPCAGILSDSERLEFLRRWKDTHAAS